MAVPMKFRQIGDFHEYYSGKRVAPYLTIFIGGNHEASNHLFELHYGGWVAPNIYYLGASNVLRCGPLRLAGLSGIWKGYDYRKPHHERLPYSESDKRSIFHVRELEVRKLLQIRTQIDLGLSHDWPRHVEYSGNFNKLFKQKRDFATDSKNGQLGSQAARYVLDRLRPAHWFSAHLHVKFAASVEHEARASLNTQEGPSATQNDPARPPKIPYNFGMDGASIATLNERREDDAQERQSDRPSSVHTANEVPTTEMLESMPREYEDPSRQPTHETPEDSKLAAITLNQAQRTPVQNEGGDTQNRLSAWNNFHTVAASQNAVEDSQFMLERDEANKHASQVEHNLTWRPVDIDEDGARRRLDESAEKPESKKQKTQHDINPVKNTDEIDLNMSSDSEHETAAQPTSNEETKKPPQEHNEVPEDIRSQLPASFARPESSSQPGQEGINGPLPEEISNKTTQFLALDKCLPNRDFLQLLELHPVSGQEGTSAQRPYRLQYDKEWLAITRVFNKELHLGDPAAKPSPSKGDIAYKPEILEAEKWVEENVVQHGKLDVPENFTVTAPFYDPAVSEKTEEQPLEYTNPQTAQFCELIGIENKFHASDEERKARAEAGPQQEERREGYRSNMRRGFGRGRRGGRNGNRGGNRGGDHRR